MKLKPFIRWAGGKQKLADEIIKNFPDKLSFKRYFEPFVGAGSIFLASGFSKAVISDINPQLINAYQFIKGNHSKVFSLLEQHYKLFKKEAEYYYDLRDLFNQDKSVYNCIQAARFIFLIQTNYNGMYRVNRQGEYNVPLGKLKPSLPTLHHLESVSKRLRDIEIECSEYKKILNSAKPKDFVYLDPPYPPLNWNNPQNQFTVNLFTQIDHKIVASTASELREMGCYVLVSYPDTHFIRKMYSGWKIVTVNAFRSISCKKERTKISELLIRNY